MVKMLLQRDFTSASSLVSYMFSFLSLSFSSIISDDALIGDELEDITCSSPEFDGEIIGFAIGTAQTDATCDGEGYADRNGVGWRSDFGIVTVSLANEPGIGSVRGNFGILIVIRFGHFFEPVCFIFCRA
ncbi:hypothetical protein ACFX1S_044119 [Malus domestica]